jgi:hypothetical protein
MRRSFIQGMTTKGRRFRRSRKRNAVPAFRYSFDTEISTIPLFAEHRLQVYLVLDRLRQQGWLVNSPQPTTSDRERQQPEGDRAAALLLG